MADDLIRSRLGTPHHTAYVTESIESTVQAMVERFGAGPFFRIEDVPLEDVVSGGEAATFDHDSAFGSWDGYPIELIQVKRVAPESVAERFSGGLPRVHHVGYALEPSAAQEARAFLDGNGTAAYLSTRLGDGQGTFHDASAILGHDIEIQDEIPAFRDFFGMVLGAADGWDGSDPLRGLPG